MGPQDILKNCKPSCNISGYTGKIRKLHNSNSDDYLHTKNSVKSIAIHYSLIQSAILTTEQEYYGSSNLIEIFGLISGYVAFFFGISLLEISSKIINFTIKWTIRNIFTKQYDDHNSVEQTIIWFPIKGPLIYSIEGRLQSRHKRRFCIWQVPTESLFVFGKRAEIKDRY